MDVTGHLESHGISYMVIGGFANLKWGRPRLTEDVDLKVEVPESTWPSFVEGLAPRFTLLPPDPLAFLRQMHVIPILTPAGVRADLVVASLPYEHAAIGRAVTIPIGNRPVRICTAEDLILHKIISERPRDRDDVEGVIIRQSSSLDRGYLDPKVQELAAGLERPEIADYYRTCLKKAVRIET